MPVQDKNMINIGKNTFYHNSIGPNRLGNAVENPFKQVLPKSKYNYRTDKNNGLKRFTIKNND